MTAVATPLASAPVHVPSPVYVVPAGEDPDRSPARRAWRAEIERLTEPHRRRRAERYARRAAGYQVAAAMHVARGDEMRRVAQLAVDAADEILAHHALDLARDTYAIATGHESRAAWHESRATGQIERFRRVTGCREEWAMTAACAGCSAVTHAAVPMACGHDRLCVHCRGRAVRRVRARLISAATYWAEEARTVNVRDRRWGYDSLGLKMITLTVPHGPSPARDATVLRDAWGPFRRRLAVHLAVDRQAPALQFWRTREETPGIREDGHVHWHVLAVMPYAHHAALRLYWARSLPADYQARLPVAQIDWSEDGAEVVAIRRTLVSGEERVETIKSPVHRRQLAQALVTRRGPHGRPLTEMPWPVIDVRGAAQYHHEAGPAPKVGSHAHRKALVKMVAEAAKYVVKDLEHVDAATGGRKLVAPAVFAELYCATDGQRRTSCTMTRRDATGRVVRRGWWYVEYLHPYERTCVDCGHVGPLECQIERIGDRMPRGP